LQLLLRTLHSNSKNIMHISKIHVVMSTPLGSIAADCRKATMLGRWASMLVILSSGVQGYARKQGGMMM
jgi:hypothetical protein